jgi:glutathione-regulated potassium-efflux system ancillary protein KefC
VEQVWFSAALWLILALIATLLSIWFRISTALSEIVVGTVAQLNIGALIGTEVLGAKSAWVSFLAGRGAIVLTFLAGAELDPGIFRTKWKEAMGVGLVGFFGPFLGAATVARYVLGWSVPSSWLAGVALSTTSVGVVYAVMLELGLNRTDFGKGILAACFVNDLGTVIALGLIFAPFTIRTLIFVGASIVIFAALPFVTPWFFGDTEDVFQSLKQSTFSSCCLAWADWRPGRAARRYCRLTSLGWCEREPWERITF